jgi:aspartyl protease family protein
LHYRNILTVNHARERSVNAKAITTAVMMKFAIWIVALAIGAAYIAPTSRPLEPEGKPEASLHITSSTKANPDGSAETILTRSGDGHFYADARINGTVIRVLVDTGASMIALTREDAQKIGLTFNESEFIDRAKTANGTVALKSITLDHVALGPVEATKVDAAIAGPGLHQSLLGQSWLRQVDEVKIVGDTMTLR